MDALNMLATARLEFDATGVVDEIMRSRLGRANNECFARLLQIMQMAETEPDPKPSNKIIITNQIPSDFRRN